jgi:PAS domain S-box-containing protein
MAAGELDTAVPVASADEIGTLAVGFNRWPSGFASCGVRDLGKLLVAQQTTEAAIDSLYDPVLVTDAAGLVTRINPAAERLFGARAELLGKPIAEVARDPRIAQAVARCAAVAGPVASEECRRRSALAVRWRPAGVSHSLDTDEGRRRQTRRRGHAPRGRHSPE